MRNLMAIALACVASSAIYAANEVMDFKVDPNKKAPTASKEAHDRWRHNRFGMFIHWGPISQIGKQLSHSRYSPSHHKGGKPYKIAPIKPEVYDIQYKTFNPVKFDPDAIVKMAKKAGVKYIVFTAKHHAGFSMFDSAVTDYDIMSSPYKKDIVKMLADACKDNDVNFGFYYSPRDWHNPDCDSDNHHDRYIKFYEAQMKELLTKYGPIYEVWFDGLGPGKWGNTSAEVMAMIRKLHPDAMVNDRGGVGADFYTPEHSISFFNRDECWEACHTVTGQWGYNPKCHAKKFPQLMEILLYTWGSDGNILLNIGPMGDGSVNPEEKERLEQIAEWWQSHGERSIRGTRGGPYMPGPWGVSTCKDDKVFLHIFRWPEKGGLKFPALTGLDLKSASLVPEGEVSLTKNDDSFTIDVPRDARGKILTTVELVFNGPTISVKPLFRVPPLTAKATLSASDNQDKVKNLNDAKCSTSWNAKKPADPGNVWLEASFEEPVTIGSFALIQSRGGGLSLNAYPQIPDENGEWKNITKKPIKVKFETMKFLPKPVTTKKFRLFFPSKKRSIKGCAEFELFAPVE